MNSPSPRVVVLDDYRRRETRGSDNPVTFRATAREEMNSGLPRQNGDGDFREFYPLRGESDTAIDAAIKLLGEGLERFDQAIALRRDNDAIGCDDCMQRVRALLPELFVWGRAIGDGFRAVILATFHSLANADDLLTEPQLLVLRNGLREIRQAPYIDFETALSIQERYEDVFLDPDPKGIGRLGEMMLNGNESIC
jgi:hypothetical protein